MPGKLLYTADALPRAPVSPATLAEDDSLQEDAKLFANTVFSSLPASEEQLIKYQMVQQEDLTLIKVREYCSKGWPTKEAVEPELKPYWAVQGSLRLVLGKNLLLYNNRIVVPPALQHETIQKIHESHQGVE